jgi:hypothetical protein
VPFRGRGGSSPPSDTTKWAAAHLPDLNQVPLDTQPATVPGDPGTATIRRTRPITAHHNDSTW